jgi:hypothetical protein
VPELIGTTDSYFEYLYGKWIIVNKLSFKFIPEHIEKICEKVGE